VRRVRGSALQQQQQEQAAVTSSSNKQQREQCLPLSTIEGSFDLEEVRDAEVELRCVRR
jgi:hypothetical protein